MSLTGIGPLLAWRKTTGAYLCARAARARRRRADDGRRCTSPSAPKLGFPAFVAGRRHLRHDDRQGAGRDLRRGAADGDHDLHVRTSPATCRSSGAAPRVRMTQHAARARSSRCSSSSRAPSAATAATSCTSASSRCTSASPARRTTRTRRPRCSPGQSFEVAGVPDALRPQPRMEVDPNKRMIFTDMTRAEGRQGGRAASRRPSSSTRSRRARPRPRSRSAPRSREDVYAIMNSVNPETKVATFRVIVRPFVAWIWLGGMMMMLRRVREHVAVGARGAGRVARARAHAGGRGRGADRRSCSSCSRGAVVFALLAPALAHAQNDSRARCTPARSRWRNAEERQLFSRLLVRVRRLPALAALDLRVLVGRGHAREHPQGARRGQERRSRSRTSYRERFGAKAIAIPEDRGMDRALWALPVAAISLMAVQLFRWGRRWSKDKASSAGCVRRRTRGRAVRARRRLRGRARRRAQALG